MDTTDIETTLNAAQSQETFDVLSFIEATAYPTAEVVVFQDVKSATEYVDLVNKRAELDLSEKQIKDEGKKNEIDVNPVYAELDKKIEDLGAKITQSTLIFELRGMPPGIVDDILKAPAEDTAELEAQRDNALIAATITGVRNSKGARDARVWDEAAVTTLRRNLKEGEFGKIVQAVSKVNFNAAVFDQATDAGFSGRSADVA